MKKTELATSDLTSQEQLSRAAPLKKHWRFWGWDSFPGRETVPHSVLIQSFPSPQSAHHEAHHRETMGIGAKKTRG